MWGFRVHVSSVFPACHKKLTKEVKTVEWGNLPPESCNFHKTRKKPKGVLLFLLILLHHFLCLFMYPKCKVMSFIFI